MTLTKHIRLLASASVLLALCLACGANLLPPQAQVNCQGVGDAYQCTVQHTAGGSGQICWDVQVTCVNGTVTSANSCVHLEPGQTVSHRVPVTQFDNFQACDTVSTVQIIDRTGR